MRGSIIEMEIAMTCKVLELKHPNGFHLGTSVLKDDGWWFYPNVSGRRPSRKGHPTADDSLPDWTKRYIAKGASFLPKETP
jgi:hypothetical protein